jgi:hypothetical protein
MDLAVAGSGQPLYTPAAMVLLSLTQPGPTKSSELRIDTPTKVSLGQCRLVLNWIIFAAFGGV